MGVPHFRKHPYACSSSAIFPRLPLNPSHLPPSSERAPQELSPYIRFGEISVKFIYAAAKQYAQRTAGFGEWPNVKHGQTASGIMWDLPSTNGGFLEWGFPKMVGKFIYS